MKRVLTLLICMILVLTATGCARKPAEKPLMKNRPAVIGYYANDIGGYDSYPSLKAHASLLNEIHPLWYHVSPDGSVQKEVNARAISVARRNGIKIIPLVNLVPSQDDILYDQAAQDRAIASLVKEVKTHNFDGIDIDFEFFPASLIKDFTVDRDQLTVFVKKMHKEMKSLGKETHMAVLPRVGSSPEVGGIYDYGALAAFLTKVSIMCYDYKEAHGPPGPVAPFNWVEDNIKEALNQGFRPDQICLGVANYGYDWPKNEAGGFARPSSEIMRQIAIKGYQVKWSDQYQEPYYVYTDANGWPREVWFENEYTLQSKLDLVDKYELAGICIWRLGFEDQRFWERIKDSWGKKK